MLLSSLSSRARCSSAFLCIQLLSSISALHASTATTAIRSHNFGPGPAALPVEVLERAQASLVNFKGTGIGIMEYTNLDESSGTHPGVAKTPLQQMFIETELKLRTTLSIPEAYHVLFLHGGAVGQFSAIPMNFLGNEGSCADYISQGFWSTKAVTEAAKYGDAKVIATFAGDDEIPWKQWQEATRPCAAYMHLVMSETVQGVELFSDPPDNWKGPPVVLDATSTLLSRPFDVSKYGMIYASGGKNIPHGVAVAIIRKEFLKSTKKLEITPILFDYRMNAGAMEPVSSVFESRPNTPPIWGVYLLGEVLDHIDAGGGLTYLAGKTASRSGLLYEIIDSSNGFYINKVYKPVRSSMNVVFNLASRDLEAQFLNKAEEAGLNFLWGHPSQGGVRVTTYNWIPDASIQAISEFMSKFYKQHSTPLKEL